MKVFDLSFKEGNHSDDFTMLDCIPHLITKEQKKAMDRIAKEEEVRDDVFCLNSDGAYVPNGFLGIFQSCWEIIKEDIIKILLLFYVVMNFQCI